MININRKDLYYKKNKRPRNWKKIINIFNISVIIFVLIIKIFEYKQEINIKEEYINYLNNYINNDIMKRVEKLLEPTNENIILWMKYYGVKYKEIVLAQIRLETGNLSSELFRKHNNLFGMKYTADTSRIISYKTENGYAGYNHWIYSIKDFAIWQSKYLKNINSEKKYLDYLSKYYAEDSNYVNKIKSIINH